MNIQCAMAFQESSAMNPYYFSENEKRYVCHLCDNFVVCNLLMLKNHLFTNHPVEKLYVCQYCDFESADKSVTKMHILQEHKQPTHCPYCNFNDDRVADVSAIENCPAVKSEFNYYEDEKIDVKDNVSELRDFQEDLVVGEPMIDISELKVDSAIMKFDDDTKKFPDLNQKPFHEVQSDQPTNGTDSSIDVQYNDSSSLEELWTVNSYGCTVCDFSTTKSEFLREHMNLEHNINSMTKEIQRPLMKISCKFCDFKTTQFFLMKRHKKAEHPEHYFPCPHCEYVATQAGNLRAHVKRKHENLLDDAEKSQMSIDCPFCDFKAITRLSMNNHKKAEHSDRVFSCPQCDHVATQAGNLRSHIKAIHESSPGVVQEQTLYDCQFCDFKATREYLLSKHIKQEHPESLFPCNFCDYEATQQWNLDKHVEYQHGNGNSLGNFVKKRTSRVCEYCDFKTAVPSLMKRHKKTRHFKDRFQCPYCEYVATQAGNLRTHINCRHTKENMVYCDYCDFKTTVKYYMKYHVQRRHSAEEAMLTANKYCKVEHD